MQLALFQIYWKCYQLGTQMGFKLVQVGAFETRKLAKVGFGKHDKKCHKKTLRFVQKWSKKRVPKKWYLRGFSGFHPSMVSRASLGRLSGSKARQNGGPDMDFLLFRDHAFTFFGDTLEYFLCSMNYKLIVLDVQFTVVFA